MNWQSFSSACILKLKWQDMEVKRMFLRILVTTTGVLIGELIGELIARLIGHRMKRKGRRGHSMAR